MAAQDAYNRFLTTPSTNEVQGYNAWRTHINGEPNPLWIAVLRQPSVFLSQKLNPASPMNMPYERQIEDGGQIPLLKHRKDGVNESEVHQKAVSRLLLENFAVQRSLLWYTSGVVTEVRKFLNSVMTIMKERQNHIVPFARMREWDNRIPLPGSKRANVTGPTNWSMTFGFHSREVIASMDVNADLTEYYKRDYEQFIMEQTQLLEAAILAGKMFYFAEFLANYAPSYIDLLFSELVTTTMSKNAYAMKNTAPIFKKAEEIYLQLFAPTISRSEISIWNILSEINEVMKQVPERENIGFDGIFCTDKALEMFKKSGDLLVEEDHDFGIVNPIYELSQEDTKKGHINISNLRGTQSLGDLNYFSNNFRCDSIQIKGKSKFVCALPKSYPHLGKKKNNPLRSEERMTRYIIVHQPFKKINSQIAKGLTHDEYYLSTSLSKHDNLVLKTKEHLSQSGLTYAGLYDPEDYFQEVLQSRDYFKDVNYMDYRKAVFDGQMKRSHLLYLYDTTHPFLQYRKSCGTTLRLSDGDTHLDFSQGNSEEPSSYVQNDALDQFESLSVGTSFYNYSSGHGSFGYGAGETGAMPQGSGSHGGGDDDSNNSSNDSDDSDSNSDNDDNNGNNGGNAPNFRSDCPYSPLMLEGNIPLVERDDMLSKVILFNAEVTKFEDSFGKEFLDFVTACCSKEPSKKQVFLAIQIRNAFGDEMISISPNRLTRKKIMYLSYLIQELASDYKSNAILSSPRMFIFAVMSIGKSNINELRDFFSSIQMNRYFENNLKQLKDMVSYYSQMSYIFDAAIKTIAPFITTGDNDLTIFRFIPSFSEIIPMTNPNRITDIEMNTDPYFQIYRVFETFLTTRTESVVMPTQVIFQGILEPENEEEEDNTMDVEEFGEPENELDDADEILLMSRLTWSKIPTKNFKTESSKTACKPVKYWFSFKYPVGKYKRRTEILRQYRCPVVFYQAHNPRTHKLPKHLVDASKFHPLFAHSPHITTNYKAHKNSIYNLHAYCKYREINCLVNLPFGILWCFNVMCHVMCKSNVHKYMLDNGIPMFRSIIILQQEKFITSSVFAVIRDRIPRIEEGPMLIVDKENNNPVKVKHHQKTLYGILDQHAVYRASNAVIEEIEEPCDMRIENLESIFNHESIRTHDKKLLTGAVPFFIHMSDVEMITKEKLPPVGGRRTAGLFNLNAESELRSCDTTRIDKALSIAPTMHPLGYQQHVLSQLERFGHQFPLGIGTHRTHYPEMPICSTLKERYESSRDRVNLKHMEYKQSGGVEMIERFTSMFHAFTRTLIAMNVWQLIRTSEGKEEIIWIQKVPFSSTKTGTTSDYDNKGTKFMFSKGEPFITSARE